MSLIFNGPIPGQSLTTEPKNAAYERAPEVTDPIKALDVHLDNLNKPEAMEDALYFLELGIDLVTLVEGNPKAKKPNTADLLVSVLEAATLLGTSVEQVYRLYQDGILQTAFRHKMNQRINPYKGVFFLRHAIEYKTSFGNDKARMYLSAW